MRAFILFGLLFGASGCRIGGYDVPINAPLHRWDARRVAGRPCVLVAPPDVEISFKGIAQPSIGQAGREQIKQLMKKVALGYFGAPRTSCAPGNAVLKAKPSLKLRLSYRERTKNVRVGTTMNLVFLFPVGVFISLRNHASHICRAEGQVEFVGSTGERVAVVSLGSEGRVGGNFWAGGEKAAEAVDLALSGLSQSAKSPQVVSRLQAYLDSLRHLAEAKMNSKKLAASARVDRIHVPPTRAGKKWQSVAGQVKARVDAGLKKVRSDLGVRAPGNRLLITGAIIPFPSDSNRAYMTLRMSDVERGSILAARSTVVENTSHSIENRVDEMLHQLVGYRQ